ncbi:MAG TPA: hypothetical protein PLV56_02960 [Synergistales bacterium]|nr:hypothetical protein [Synergistales bacterium]
MNKGWSDLLAYGKVVSTALLICGYIVLGFMVGQKLVNKGYPSWITIVLSVCGAFFGIWQGWIWLRSFWQR